MTQRGGAKKGVGMVRAKKAESAGAKTRKRQKDKGEETGVKRG